MWLSVSCSRMPSAIGVIAPGVLIFGGCPSLRWRSEAPDSTRCLKYWSITAMTKKVTFEKLLAECGSDGVGIDRTTHCLIFGNEALVMQFDQCVIHHDHTDLFTSLHHTRKHEGFSVANQGGNRRRIHEKLKSEFSARAVFLRNQLLRDDASQRF